MSSPASIGPAALALLLAAQLGGCVESPRAFERIDLEEAQRRLGAGSAEVVEVTADAGRRLERADHPLWVVRGGEATPSLPPDLPRGAILLISSRRDLAERAAAALVRSADRHVAVFVSDNAEDRTRLYALGGPAAPTSTPGGSGSAPRSVDAEPLAPEEELPHGRDS